MRVFDLLFGCSHKQISFPITRKAGQRRSAAALQTGTYIVCLDCGKEFAYDWQQMRVLTTREQHSRAHAHVEAEAS